MYDDNPLHLKLPERLQHKVYPLLCSWVETARQAASERDERLLIYEDQLEGATGYSAPVRYRGQCTLDDPITLEAQIGMKAAIARAVLSEQKITAEANQPGDEEAASVYEAWQNDGMSSREANQALDDVIYYATSQPCGVLRTSWERRFKRTRGVAYVKSDDPDGPRYSEDEREEGQEYDAVPTVTDGDVEFDGLEYRAVSLSDVYLYPPTAQSFQSADLTAERLLWTENDLLNAIDAYGLDMDAVDQLIAVGPTVAPDGETLHKRQEEGDGTQDQAEFGDGYYECFLIFSRMPHIREGKRDLTRDWRGDDFMGVLCPEHQLALSFDFSPYQGLRPYSVFNIYGRPNRLQGHCVPSMLNALQAEANANLRMGIDSMNVYMQPMMKVRRDSPAFLERWIVQPGGKVGVDMMDDIEPLVLDKGARDALPIQQDIRNRAKGLVAAEGAGEMDTKVRKAAEVVNVQMQADLKGGHYLQCFCWGLVEWAEQRAAITRMRMDGEQKFRYQGREWTLTAQVLEKRFKVAAAATSQTQNPQTRLEIGRARYETMRQYWTDVAMASQSGNFDVIVYLWHGARDVLRDMGTRDPESLIGPDPTQQVQQMKVQAAQAAQQPHISVALSGKLTPEQEAQAAQSVLGTPMGMGAGPQAMNGNGATAGNGVAA